jgi:hypothetical protein
VVVAGAQPAAAELARVAVASGRGSVDLIGGLGGDLHAVRASGVGASTATPMQHRRAAQSASAATSTRCERLSDDLDALRASSTKRLSGDLHAVRAP